MSVTTIPSPKSSRTDPNWSLCFAIWFILSFKFSDISEILEATLPNSPESSFKAFIYLFFVLPFAIFDAKASKLEMLLYKKFAKIMDVNVAIISNEKTTNTNEISLLAVKVYDRRTPAPIDKNTIKNIRNLNPIFSLEFLRTYTPRLLWFEHTYPLSQVFLLIFLYVCLLFL